MESKDSCNDCWCVPDEGVDGECPDIGDRVISYGQEIIDTYKSFSLELTSFEDLPHLIAVGGKVPTPENIADPSCVPFPNLVNVVNLPLCEQPPIPAVDEDGSVCGFVFEDDDDCMSRRYGMETFKFSMDFDILKTVITHKGACGVCSNAMDLAALLEKDNFEGQSQCALIDDIDSIYECYQGLGFTPECSWLLATSALNCALSGCKNICSQSDNDNIPWNDPVTCALNDCIVCDEKASKDILMSFGGRVRANSGIIFDVKRTCSEVANFKQEPCYFISEDSPGLKCKDSVNGDWS